MARPTFTAASIALMALFAFAPAQAAAQGTVIFQSGQPERGYQSAPIIQVITAPPPLRREATPPPRRGKVWEQGHWEWRGNRHQWVRGHWVQARAGYDYRQPQWVQHDGRWEMQRGGWDRGRHDAGNRHDGDRNGYGNGMAPRNGYGNGNGMAPRNDRDGDGVANRNDRDRDGDGVPNRRDNQPDNPRRD